MFSVLAKEINFTLSDNEVTYNKLSHKVEINHDELPYNELINVVLNYQDGNINSGTHAVTIKDITAVDTIKLSNYIFNIEGVKSTLKINKAKVVKPTVVTTAFLYDGSLKTLELALSEDYTISGNSETNAGKYSALVSLNDKANYEWEDSTDTDLAFIFTIKAQEASKDQIKLDPSIGESSKPIIDISSPSGIDPEININVSKVDSPKVSDKLNKDEVIHSTINVDFSKNNELISPEDIVEVKILIPEDLQGKDFALVDQEGNKIDFEVEDGYAKFNTNKLGEFSFITKKASMSKGAVAGLVVVSVVLASTLTANVVVFAKKRRNKKGLQA